MRRALWLLLCGVLLHAGAGQAQDERPSLLVLYFEIEDDNLAQGAPVDVGENERRLALAYQVVHDALVARGGLRVIDSREIAERIAQVRRTQALHACNGCEFELARAAGAQFVLVGWVQKVSNLILNINAGVRNVRTEADVLTRSVDMRGNTDASWSRAAARLARDIADRLERAPPTP